MVNVYPTPVIADVFLADVFDGGGRRPSDVSP
jgi:hypothetical protein